MGCFCCGFCLHLPKPKLSCDWHKVKGSWCVNKPLQSKMWFMFIISSSCISIWILLYIPSEEFNKLQLSNRSNKTIIFNLAGRVSLEARSDEFGVIRMKISQPLLLVCEPHNMCT